MGGARQISTAATDPLKSGVDSGFERIFFVARCPRREMPPPSAECRAVSVSALLLLIALLYPLKVLPEKRDVEVDDSAAALADDALFEQPTLVLRGVAA